MANNSLDKTLKEAEKKSQKLEQERARRQRAQSIVSGQPFVNGFRIMDDVAEVVLKALTDHCTNQESGNVSYTLGCRQDPRRYLCRSVESVSGGKTEAEGRAFRD